MFYLKENQNNNIIYGVIKFLDKNGKDIKTLYLKDLEEIQQKIYEIKNNYYENGNNEWLIEDLLKELSKTYNFHYERVNDNYYFEI